MLVQLNFYNPLYVSLHSKYLDKILFVIDDPSFFINKKGNQMQKQTVVESKTLPPLTTVEELS